MKVLQNLLPEVPGIVARAYRRTYRSSGYGYECPTELPKVPDTGNTRVNTHPLEGQFDFEVEASHVLTVGQCPRGNLS